MLRFLPLCRRRASDGLAVFLLFAYLVAGVFGRDPWKADEPYSFGVTLNFVQGGDWLVPHVASEPFLEKSPLMYWSGALFAAGLRWLLPLHAGAQMATLLWMGMAVAALAYAGGLLYGERRRFAVCALALCAVGSVTHVHKFIADVPQLAGCCLALMALVMFCCHARDTGAAARVGVSRTAGLLFGTGVGIAFMSKGLLLPGVFAVTLSAAAVVLPALRCRESVVALGWAALAALPWFLIWPFLLWQSDPAHFMTWLWDNNLARFFGSKEQWPDEPSRIGLALIIAALSLPSGALAACAIASRFKARAEAPATAFWLVALFAMTMAGTLTVSSSFREVYLLPLYPALGLLALGAAVGRRTLRIVRRLTVIVAFVTGALAWTLWGTLLAGAGHLVPLLGRWLPLDFHLRFDAWSVAAALLVTGASLYTMLRHTRHGVIGAVFACTTLCWAVPQTLLLPWFNDARSYRDTFQALTPHLPAGHTCLTSVGLGESERAMLHYFSKVKPRMAATASDAHCDALVLLDSPSSPRVAPPPPWRLVWQGGRHGDDNERFRLFLRD